MDITMADGVYAVVIVLCDYVISSCATYRSSGSYSSFP